MIVEFIIAHYHEGKIKRCTLHTNDPPRELLCQVVDMMIDKVCVVTACRSAAFEDIATQ